MFEIWLYVVFDGVRGQQSFRRHCFYPGIQILRISPSVRAVFVTIGTRNKGSRSCGRIRERRCRKSLIWAVNQSTSDALIRKTNKPYKEVVVVLAEGLPSTCPVFDNVQRLTIFRTPLKNQYPCRNCFFEHT